MKGLKISPAALCMVLAPMPALAEIQPLAPDEMGAITGQAGVTIELATEVSVGEFVAPDGQGTTTINQNNSLFDALRGSVPGEGGLTIDLETKIDIDQFRYLPGNGGMFSIDNISIGGTNRDNHFSELGSLLGTAPSTMLDDVRMEVDLMADGDAHINIHSQTGGAIDVGVRTGQWMLAGSTDSTVIMDNFYMDALLEGAAIVVDTQTDTLMLGAGLAISNLELDADFLALGIRNFRLTGANYDPDNPQVGDLYADVGMYIYHGVAADGGSALAIEMPRFDADVTIGGVLLGGTSIGAIALDDLSITNTSMRIYGH